MKDLNEELKNLQSEKQEVDERIKLFTQELTQLQQRSF